MSAVETRTVKRCPSCAETKSVEEFYRDRTQRDGLTSACKPCKRARNRRRIAEARKAGLCTTCLAVPACDDGTTCERCREGAREWREAHPDYAREWREAHPDYDRNKRDARREAGLCIICEAPTADGISRCSRHLAQEAAYNRLRTKAARDARLASWESRGLHACWICGGSGPDSTDHLIPRSEGGSDEPYNLAPAHRSCNAWRGTRSVAEVVALMWPEALR